MGTAASISNLKNDELPIFRTDSYEERLAGITTCDARDDLITDFGKDVLRDRYLSAGEKIQERFARVAAYHADDLEHARKLYEYISKHWFMPATPVLTNIGRHLPISCFLNETADSLTGIVDTWKENIWLSADGGGIGTYWGNVRSIGERVGEGGKSSGIIPFVKVQDSLSLAISQGNLRRGSAAVYLPVWHPEIVEFLEMRKPTGGDPNRKALNLHHGIAVSDAFMEAVIRDEMWALRSPSNGDVVEKVKARDLWVKILTARIETGEPYIIYIDTVNEGRPEAYKKLGLEVKTSNLCSEIMLATGPDHLGNERTAVCCLSSLNLERYEEWKNVPDFIFDVMRFLDNVLQDFIDRASERHAKARYSALRERSVGLGVMGFHSFLQSKGIPMDSVTAKVWNKKIFSQIKQEADSASRRMAEVRGACPDAVDAGVMERNIHKIAVAPTASISIIAGSTSPSTEPYAANIFTQKTLSGSSTVYNRHLRELLKSKGHDTQAVWSSIALNEGSVQHLDILSDTEKEVFKTAFEIDQRWIIDLAADRVPYICQAASLNLFLPADVHKRVLHELLLSAWSKGVKSLYYQRSLSLQRAGKVKTNGNSKSGEGAASSGSSSQDTAATEWDKEECLACQ